VAVGKFLPRLKECYQVVSTFLLTTFAWIYFRAENITIANKYIKSLFSFDFGIDYLRIERYSFESLPVIILLLAIEWPTRHREFTLEPGRFHTLKLLGIIALILLMGSYTENQQFIYFQF